MKKLVSIVLALALVLMAVAAFASAPDISDTNGTFTYTTVTHDSTTSSLKVTNTGSQTHKFTLYQLLVGDVTSSGTSHIFSNISWGNGVTTDGVTAYGDATAKAKTITTTAAAKAFADDLVDNSYLQNGSSQNVAAAASYTWTGLNPGYYLVLDETEGLGDGTKTDSYSAYVMQVVGAVERNAKIAIPSVDKVVGDVNDSTGVTGSGNSADYDVGDKVPFTITGTLPSNFGEYETYKSYNFVDRLSAGLTPPEADDINVKLNGTTDIKDYFDVAVSGQTITITLKSTADMKTIATSETDTVVVTYEATLNSSAVIGADGNENEVDLIFSNNPNQDGDGDTGKVTDTVLVFTYRVEVNKITGAGTANEGALQGAAFALYKNYNTVPSDKTEVTEIKYDNNQKTYTIASGDHWVLVGSTTAGTTTTFQFDRVDDGEYLLVETTTPAGYNSIEPKKFTVTATHDEALTEVNGEGVGTDPIDLGVLTIDNKLAGVTTDIDNEGGVTLPSTGGIGTTIFYILGGLLVVGAAVILVARRKAQD